MIGNKTADKIGKSKLVPKVNLRKVEEIGVSTGDAYAVVKETVIVEDADASNGRNKGLAVKNNTPFRSCISKRSKRYIENAKDSDIVIQMYNILGYSANCCIAGSF